MLRTVSVLFLAVFASALCVNVQAEDKKVETLEGSITCAKCDLGLEKACKTVIKVKDSVYYFDAKAHKKEHGTTCTAAKDGTVEGVVTKAKDGKLTVEVKKVTYK
jgi:hypothetical protein